MSLSRQLPAGCAVRRATSADARRVAHLLRAPDRAEMEALEGCPALEVLQGWMTSTPRVLTIRGEPVVIYGILAAAAAVGQTGYASPGHAAPWLAIVSTIAHEDLMNVMWLSRAQVDSWQRRWAVLQAVCDVRNHFHRQWLDWLGFVRQGRVETFGAAGLPFERYQRVRRTALH